MLNEEFKSDIRQIFGLDEKKVEDESIANFGNMSEPIFAVCAAAFVITEEGIVSPTQVISILKTMRQEESTAIYDLAGENNIFDFEAQKNIQAKDALIAKKKAEKNHIIDEVGKYILQNKDKNLIGPRDENFDSDMRKYIVNVDNEPVYVIAFVAGQKGKIVNGKTIPQKNLIDIYTHNIDKYFPNMEGEDDGSAIKIKNITAPYIGFKYAKFENKSDIQKFEKLNESIVELADVPSHKTQDVPKLDITVNHNVISTIKNILDEQDSAKYNELLSMIEALSMYLMHGKNDISKIRSIYWNNKKAKKPSHLVIRLMGKEGQSAEGKGIVKGDVEIRILDESGEPFQTTLSMKYGNKQLHKFSSVEAMATSVTEAFNIADFNSASIIKNQWRDAISAYPDNIKGLIGLSKNQKTPGLYTIIKTMTPVNKSKTIFCFLERFGHGAEESSIISIEKKGGKVHTLPTLLTHYLYYQGKFIDVIGGKFIYMRIKDDNKIYGILKVKDGVSIDGGMMEFIEHIKKIFNDQRTDMWSLIMYYKYMYRTVDKYKNTKTFLRTYKNKADSYFRDSLQIFDTLNKGKTDRSIISVLDNIDSEQFKKSEILQYMNGELDSLSPEKINTFATVMANKIKEMYEIIATYKVSDPQ